METLDTAGKIPTKPTKLTHIIWKVNNNHDGAEGMDKSEFQEKASIAIFEVGLLNCAWREGNSAVPRSIVSCRRPYMKNRRKKWHGRGAKRNTYGV